MQLQHNRSEQGSVSPHNARIAALKAKHSALSKKIEHEQHSYNSEGLIAQLKKEKLLIKEQIEGIK